MNRDDVDWRGYFPAVVTPFTEDGRLDLDTLADLVNFYADNGMHGMVINGTCGEWFSQNHDERRAVAETVVATAAGRMRVLISCTDYTADNVVKLARHALSVGADGVLASPPPYSKLFPNEIIAYYQDISDGIKAQFPDGPLVVYNWPHGSGVDIGPDLADQLAGISQIVAVKDSTPDADQFFETSRRVRDRLRVFGPYMSVRGRRGAPDRGRRRLRRRWIPLGEAGSCVLGGVLGRGFRIDDGARAAGRRAVPAALAAGWLGRFVRRIPEPAQGADEDARPAGRTRPAAAIADHRPRVTAGHAGRADLPWPAHSERRRVRSRGMGSKSGARMSHDKGLARGREIALIVDGQARTARLGESVAAALMADGDDLELRETVGGEPRGLFCGMGVCFDCLVIVDGIPSTRACVTWVRDGMVVDRQRGPGYPYEGSEDGLGNPAGER